MIMICPVCGKEFEGKGRKRFCSPVCQMKGSRQTRKEWEQKTGYLEKLRESRRIQRAEESEAKRNEAEKARKKHHRAEKQRDRRAETREQKARQKRAEKGDYYALMDIAQEDGDMLSYWKYYKLEELAFCKSMGKDSTRKVNGIPVQDEDFEIKVIETIKRFGEIQATVK